jgi:hypothetical protein
MAGKRQQKSGSKPRVQRVHLPVAAKEADTGARKPASEKERSRGLRKQIRRLEEMLASAARKETSRLRKLEKTHLRRQRLEAEIDELRGTKPPAPSISKSAPPAAPGPLVEPANAGNSPASSAGSGVRRRTRTTAPVPAATADGSAAPAARRTRRLTPAAPAPAARATRRGATTAVSTPRRRAAAKSEPAEAADGSGPAPVAEP